QRFAVQRDRPVRVARRIPGAGPFERAVRAAVRQFGDERVDHRAEGGPLVLAVVLERGPGGRHTVFPVGVHRGTLARTGPPRHPGLSARAVSAVSEAESPSPGLRAACRRKDRRNIMRLTRPMLALTGVVAALRSEEHTSELQSRENIVCRLLLEKKK